MACPKGVICPGAAVGSGTKTNSVPIVKESRSEIDGKIYIVKPIQ